jgi:uncharacterized membrane protein
MNIAKALMGSFCAGAATMYFADPVRGRRRRIILRDKVNAGLRDVARELDKAGRDFRNRTQGMTAAVRTLTSRAEADEEIIVERVRSAIGRAVSHPHAITVTAEPGGRVTLDGPVLAHEVACLIQRVEAVQGVKSITDRLDIHREPGALACLQGGRPRGVRSELAQESWTPVLRVAAGALAGTALLSSARRDGPLSFASAVAGGALLARAITNRDFRQIFGTGGTHTVEFDKTVHILAPVEEVFAFWQKLENFPKFMAHLREVHDLGGGRSRWVAEGPAGMSATWEAEIVEEKKNERLAWRSDAKSMIHTEGVVRFSSTADGGTRVSIHMCYCPPAGVFGHGVAWLFGADPKSDMDEDLVRLKSLLEVGKTRAHGSTVWRDGLELAAT